jgi:hypothetical protein
MQVRCSGRAPYMFPTEGFCLCHVCTFMRVCVCVRMCVCYVLSHFPYCVSEPSERESERGGGGVWLPFFRSYFNGNVCGLRVF